MTEVVKDQGLALVHPVTLGYVCNPVAVELHVSPLSVLAPHHQHASCPYPAVAVSGHPRGSRRALRGRARLRPPRAAYSAHFANHDSREFACTRVSEVGVWGAKRRQTGSSPPPAFLRRGPARSNRCRPPARRVRPFRPAPRLRPARRTFARSPARRPLRPR